MTNVELIPLGFFVGTLVGLTGVGGGAVLTPLLVLIFGVRPALAVGTDLAFAAVTKIVGSVGHVRRGNVDPGLVLRLSLGSIPGSLLGVYLTSILESYGPAFSDEVLSKALGLALVAAAAANLLRAVNVSWQATGRKVPAAKEAVALGLVVGALVGVTSIGAGSLLMAAFVLYSIAPNKAVGSDVLHGAVLATVAALAHGAVGRVDLNILATLLVGSLPGVLLGVWLSGRVQPRPLRVGIAAMLAITGARLLV